MDFLLHILVFIIASTAGRTSERTLNDESNTTATTQTSKIVDNAEKLLNDVKSNPAGTDAIETTTRNIIDATRTDVDIKVDRGNETGKTI